MATYEAISGVSATIRNLLLDRMERSVAVTVAPPDVQVTGVPGSRVNLYLYHVEENAHLKNQEIPGQGHPAAYGQPPLSLDLHYLLTAFPANEAAADADLDAQQSLGDAMRVLHDVPTVTEDLHQNDDPMAPRILDPSLLGEFERIGVTLEPAETEEILALWGALPQASFRRSVSYRCSVVQIESLRPRRSAPPVKERRVYAFTLASPQVEDIVREPAFPGYPSRPGMAATGDTVVIRGRNLRGDATSVVMGSEVVPVPDPRASRISLTVPASLPAGLHAVHVVHDLLLDAAEGDPPVPHRGFASNAIPFLVLPTLSLIAPGTASAGTTVTLTVDPPVEATQSRVMLVGDIAIVGESVDPDTAPSATVSFRLPDGARSLPAGIHLVRVRVDGAESLLTVDPGTQAYVGPTLTVV